MKLGTILGLLGGAFVGGLVTNYSASKGIGNFQIGKVSINGVGLALGIASLLDIMRGDEASILDGLLVGAGAGALGVVGAEVEGSVEAQTYYPEYVAQPAPVEAQPEPKQEFIRKFSEVF